MASTTNDGNTTTKWPAKSAEQEADANEKSLWAKTGVKRETKERGSKKSRFSQSTGRWSANPTGYGTLGVA